MTNKYKWYIRIIDNISLLNNDRYKEYETLADAVDAARDIIATKSPAVPQMVQFLKARPRGDGTLTYHSIMVTPANK